MANRTRVSIGNVHNVVKDIMAIEEKLLEIFDFVDDAAIEAIYGSLEPAFELSQDYVPYDTGRLHDSGFLEVIGGSRRSRRTVVIGYGRGNHPDYALFVHEMVQIPHASPTRAKFLESALEEEMDNIESDIDAYMRHAFRKIVSQVASTKTVSRSKPSSVGGIASMKWGG